MDRDRQSSMPPRRATRPSTPELLWINRTPNSERLSASRQEPDEVRTITNHARQWRAALRRQQRLRNAQSEASSAQSVVGWTRQSLLGEGEDDSADSSASASPLPPARRLPGTSGEGFSYLENPDDAWWSRPAFEYAVQTWLPSVIQTLDRFDESLVAASTSLRERIVQACLANRMHMFAILAASTGYQKFVLGQQLDKHDSPEYCVTRTIQYLRHHLTNDPAPDEMVILDLRALSAFEIYVSNFAGATTHLRMIQHLVGTMGGFDALDPALAALCWTCDLSVATSAGSPPVFPLTWDVDAVPDENMQQIQHDLQSQGVSPAGSRLLQFSDDISSARDLSAIISDTVQWFRVVQHSLADHGARNTHLAWARVRAKALLHRILSLSSIPHTSSSSSSSSSPPTTPSPTPLRPLHSAVAHTLALLIHTASLAALYSQTSTSSTHVCSVQILPSLLWRLRSALAAFDVPPWTCRNWQVVFWMCSVAAQVAEAGEDGERAWFLGLAARVARAQGGMTRDQVVDLLGGYLYLLDGRGRVSVSGLEVFWQD